MANIKPFDPADNTSNDVSYKASMDGSVLKILFGRVLRSKVQSEK